MLFEKTIKVQKDKVLTFILAKRKVKNKKFYSHGEVWKQDAKIFKRLK